MGPASPHPVSRLSADGPLVEAWCTVYAAQHEADTGDRLSVDGLVRAVRASEDLGGDGVQRWLLMRGDVPAGVGQVRTDGTAGFARVYVVPQWRRQGIGRALLAPLMSCCGPRPLRGLVTAGEPGEHFAAAVGARPLLRLVEMALDLRPRHGPAAEQRPAAEHALPAGCRLQLWRGAAPDPLLAAYAAAKTGITDAPGARYQVDPDWTPERVRAWEARLRDVGRTLWCAAALTDDGTVAALTEMSADDGPRAAQHDTVVVAAHRRLGLGTAVKSALTVHVLSERPDLVEVRTTVNADNAGMIAVNRRVGYRMARRRLLVELGGPPPTR